MKKHDSEVVKQSLFSKSLFAAYLGILLLMSGLHIGLLVLASEKGWNKIIQTLVPIAYWALVAAGVTLFIRQRIRKVYEEPLHKMAEATEKVADGDFSVYS